MILEPVVKNYFYIRLLFSGYEEEPFYRLEKEDTEFKEAFCMNDQILQISARIRELRDILGMDSKEVAEKLGISEAEYLHYENGEDDIPISVLYDTAGIFEVDPTVLLTGEAPRMDSYTIVRKGQGMRVERCPGYSFESLAYNYIGRVMEPMVVTVAAKDEPAELICHGGQEFNYVISGKIAVVIGAKTIVLNEGDSIYFDPRIRHGQYAVDGEARFLTVIDKE